ncbi:MAG TPA: AbrB/MazE/SpoVT family DNA-binding domain-containing protein [Armatimonadota bacterium]
MAVKVARWGNSLAVRIHKSVADETGLVEGGTMWVTLEADGSLHLHPARPRYSLDQLLEGLDPETLHPECDWGPPVGREVW